MSDPNFDIKQRLKEQYRFTVVPQYHQMIADLERVLRENDRLRATNMRLIQSGIKEYIK